MNAPAIMTNCLSEETLAAFVDGRLDGNARTEVLEHIAECSDCRSIVVAVREFKAADGSAEVVPFRSRRAFWSAAIAAGLAAMVFLVPESREWVTLQVTGGMPEVVESYKELRQRPVEARFSENFPYKQLKRTVRGGEPGRGTEAAIDDDSLHMAVTASELNESASISSSRQQRALAAANLLSGNRDGALLAIERARKAGAESNPQFLTDAAAVYLERARFGRDADTALAVRAADLAWQSAKTPANAWNRALAYELAGRDADALRAWREYLAMDSTSEWASEANDHVARLTPSEP